MMKQITNRLCLSGNALKIIAAIAMVIDHVGYFLYTDQTILRVIGRIAFPVFAFMIGEGCYYTKNKWKYFLGIFGCALLFESFNLFFIHMSTMCVLVTFSLSILLIYEVQFLKEKFLFCGSILKTVLGILLFGMGVAAVYYLNQRIRIDYGFWGCMLPVFAALWRKPKTKSVPLLEKMDILPLRVLTFGVGLLILALDTTSLQMYSLLAVPLLMLYSEKRGKWRLKWFFYVFYPAHIIIIYGIGHLFFW